MTASSDSRESLPRGEVNCRYSERGRWTRAAADVPELATGVGGWIVGGLVLALPTAFVIVATSEQLAVRVLGAIAIAALGLGVGFLVLWLWGVVWPTAWKRHWRIRVARVAAGMGHSTITLYSKHYHRVTNLRCIVRAPSGEEWEHWWSIRHHILGPGEGTSAFVYPQAFDPQNRDPARTPRAKGPPAPWPEALAKVGTRPYQVGRYRIRWLCDSLRVSKPIILATRSWRVTP
jgi:hypothetical protein